MSAVTRMTFHSKTLLRPVELMAAFPVSRNQERKRTLWALHCAMEDGGFFFNALGAAALAKQHDIAIIAPGLGNGFFLNTSYEPQGDFLEEAADYLPSILAISSKKSENAVLGVSMGGFGAMRWALESDRFFGAAAISGVFDASLPPDKRFRENEKLAFIHDTFDALMRSRLTDAAGQLPGGGNLRSVAASHEGKWPDLWFYCGKEDYLSLNQTESFSDYCRELGAPCHLNKRLPGNHDIAYWSRALPAAVRDLFPC